MAAAGNKKEIDFTWVRSHNQCVRVRHSTTQLTRIVPYHYCFALPKEDIKNALFGLLEIKVV
jgi:hypothetical protein